MAFLRYNENFDLMINDRGYIPARHVVNIYHNMKEKDLPYDLASPVFPITREMGAFILANPPF